MSVILVYGVPGSGKSVLLHSLVREQEDSQRFFVIDHAEEWGSDAEHWLKHPPKNLTIFEDGDSLPDSFPETGVFVFRGWDPLEIASIALSLGWTTFVDDEIDASGGKSGWDESPLKEFVHRGRHIKNAEGEICQVHLMGACRRPQSLHTDLSSLADQIYVFRVQGTLTLNRLRMDSTIEDEAWDAVRRLETGNFLHWPSGMYYRPKGPAWVQTNSPDLISLPDQAVDNSAQGEAK